MRSIFSSFCSGIDIVQASALAVEDITDRVEDGAALSELILQQIATLERTISQPVTTVCTGSGVRAARERAIQQRPNMLSLDCASHQVCTVLASCSTCA